MGKKSLPLPAPTGTTDAPAAPVQHKRKPMSAAHKAKLREAMARRQASPGTTPATGRPTPIETLRAAARGRYSLQQIDQAIAETQAELGVLQGIRNTLQPERTMSAGGGTIGV